MQKPKKTDKKLELNKTTLRRLDLAAVCGGVKWPPADTAYCPTFTSC